MLRNDWTQPDTPAVSELDWLCRDRTELSLPAMSWRYPTWNATTFQSRTERSTPALNCRDSPFLNRPMRDVTCLPRLD